MAPVRQPSIKTAIAVADEPVFENSRKPLPSQPAPISSERKPSVKSDDEEEDNDMDSMFAAVGSKTNPSSQPAALVTISKPVVVQEEPLFMTNVRVKPAVGFATQRSTSGDSDSYLTSSSSKQPASNQTAEFHQQQNSLSNKISCIYKKAPSVESIKSLSARTIVTPIELEPNDGHEGLRSREVNIIKLEDTDNVGGKAAGLLHARDEHESISMLTGDLSTSRNKLNGAVSNGKDASVGDDNEILLNDLFDWLLWIDHTLQTQVITVGNAEEIQQSISKYDVSGAFASFFFM
jgi:hypothetical protein